MLECHCTIDLVATDSACSHGWIEASLLSRRFLPSKKEGGVGVLILLWNSLLSRRSGGCILRMLRPRATSCLRPCFWGVVDARACMLCRFVCLGRSVCLPWSRFFLFYVCIVCCCFFLSLSFSVFMSQPLLSDFGSFPFIRSYVLVTVILCFTLLLLCLCLWLGFVLCPLVFCSLLFSLSLSLSSLSLFLALPQHLSDTQKETSVNIEVIRWKDGSDSLGHLVAKGLC